MQLKGLLPSAIFLALMSCLHTYIITIDCTSFFSFTMAMADNYQWSAIESAEEPTFPVFEHYLYIDPEEDVRGGNFSLNDDHMRFFIHPDNTPNNTYGSVTRGQHAAGFHNVSLLNTSEVCVLWSHRSTPDESQDVSYFGIADRLESIRRQAYQETLKFIDHENSKAHNFDHQTDCLDLKNVSQLNKTYGVGVGAECSTTFDQFVEVKVWSIWKEMNDGTTQDLYPLDCPTGTISTQDHVSCTLCPPGTVSNSSSNECHQCQEGSIPNASRAKCIPCKDYEYSPVNDSFCYSCQTGYIPSETRENCTACETYEVSAVNASACHSCGPGKIPTKKQDKCVSCKDFEYSGKNDSRCFSCGPGRIPCEFQESCIPCEQHQMSLGNSSDCFSCPNGTVPNANQSACITCEGHTIATEKDYICRGCSNGTIPNSLQSECILIHSRNTTMEADTTPSLSTGTEDHPDMTLRCNVLQSLRIVSSKICDSIE